jgi:hypothetical protein
VRVLYLIIFLFVTSAVQAHAQVIITEAFPMPSEGPEWVELYNISDQALALQNWRLQDQLTSPTVIHTFTTEVLQPHSYFVIDLTSAKLNNSADGVTLFDHQNTVIDQMGYTSSEAGMSWSRVSNETNGFVMTIPTKGLPNPAPSPSPSPTPTLSPSPSPSPSTSPVIADWWSTITFLELIACPSSGNEEGATLINASDSEHTLENWKIKDESGQSRTFTNTIPSHQTVTVNWSGSLFNNSGDTAYLIDPSGTTRDEWAYEECTTGENIQLTDQLATTAVTYSLTPAPTLTPIPSQRSSVIMPSKTSFISYLYTPQDILLGSISAQSLKKQPPIIEFIQPTISPLPITGVILGGLLLISTSAWTMYEESIRNN